ncbi:MAG: Veg family protein [Bacilli bacterium]|nr:Veg family protein [Bacilli bacterium]
MNKELLREKMKEKEGHDYLFIFNGSRNQVEEFEGTITSTYPSVFIVETIEEFPKIRSFSYNDLITSNLEIREK